MQYSAVYYSPIGNLGIATTDDALTHIEFLPKQATIIPPQNELANEVIKQLDNYFASAKREFDLPITLEGTSLQINIWQAMRKINVGQTQKYGELAVILQTNPRVIGNACRANPIPIIVPCHRIIAANSLGGYAGNKEGELLGKKIWLLEHEHAMPSYG